MCLFLKDDKFREGGWTVDQAWYVSHITEQTGSKNKTAGTCTVHIYCRLLYQISGCQLLIDKVGLRLSPIKSKNKKKGSLNLDSLLPHLNDLNKTWVVWYSVISVSLC